MKRFILLAILAAFLTAPVSVVHAQTSLGDMIDQLQKDKKKPGKKGACYVYQHANFKGERMVIPANTDRLAFGKFNDRASSAMTTGSCSMVLFQHIDLRGKRRGVMGKDPGGWGNFNDSASSARCSC